MKGRNITNQKMIIASPIKNEHTWYPLPSEYILTKFEEHLASVLVKNVIMDR